MNIRDGDEYYKVDGTVDEAYNTLITMIPQYSIKMAGSGTDLNAELGMFSTYGISNSVMYYDYYWKTLDSSNLVFDNVLPVITTLSLSYLHTFSNSSLVYSLFK